jgi:hypothetical protein
MVGHTLCTSSSYPPGRLLLDTICGTTSTGPVCRSSGRKKWPMRQKQAACPSISSLRHGCLWQAHADSILFCLITIFICLRVVLATVPQLLERHQSWSYPRDRGEGRGPQNTDISSLYVLLGYVSWELVRPPTSEGQIMLSSVVSLVHRHRFIEVISLHHILFDYHCGAFLLSILS